jgi:hypothetical protein
MRSSVSGRHYTKLRKDCQTRVNFGRVIQLSAVDQLELDQETLGARTLKLMFKALIASISVSVKSNEVVSRLDSSLFAVFVLGMTAMPFCVAQRRRTWPGSVPDFRPCHTLQEE